MLVSLTFDLENSRFGGWVWGPRGLLRGFQFHPPSRKYSRMGRRRRALLSDTGPLASVRQSQSQSQIYRRLSADISSERRAHLVQLVVQLSGLFERIQAKGAAGVGLLVGVGAVGDEC
jgi:hypothetical protein